MGFLSCVNCSCKLFRPEEVVLGSSKLLSVKSTGSHDGESYRGMSLKTELFIKSDALFGI